MQIASIIMNKIDIKPYESFENRQFYDKKEIVIDVTSFYEVIYNEEKTTYNFNYCEFEELTITNVEEINFERISIYFYGCKIRRLIIENVFSKNFSVAIYNSLVNGNISSNNIISVEIHSCIIIDSFFLQNQNNVNVIYALDNIYPLIWRDILRTTDIRNVNDLLSLGQSFYIYDCKKISFISTDSRKGKTGIAHRNYPIEDSPFRIQYYLNEAQKQLLNISINIKYSPEVSTSNTIIKGFALNSLSLEGNSTGKISIENTKIENWYIRNFSTEKDAIFYDIMPLDVKSKKSKIEFHKSNLDKIWFDNVNFKSYSLVSYFRTRIGKAIFTSCTFPDNYAGLENIHYPDIKSDNFNKDQYETFLQFKASLESTSNIYEAQHFQALSNDALNRIETVSFWDKLILKFNRETNNHGISIKRPFILFWCCGIVLYFFYIVSLGYVFNNNDFNWSLWGSYFTFLDITHKIDFLVEKEKLNGWSQFVDFASKAILGYLIFQFVAAFRKYGKK